jgi:hypothetical protein
MQYLKSHHNFFNFSLLSVICYVCIIMASCDHKDTKVTYTKADAEISSDIGDTRSYSNRLKATKSFTTIRLGLEKAAMRVSGFVKNPIFIPLETTEKSVIGNVEKVIFCNEKILVLDGKISKGIFVFSKNGKFLFKLGDGKIVAPNDMAILKNELLVLDKWHSIQRYNLKNGNFISQISLPFHATSLAVSDANQELVEFFLGYVKEGFGIDYKLVEINLKTKEITSKDFPK